MKNTNILYGIIGVLIAIIIIGLVCMSKCGGYHHREYKNIKMSHQTHNGSMMNNSHDMSMESMMANMMTNLEGKTGDEFDKEFLVEMIVHHKGAVSMAQAALSSSKRPEIIKLANDIISAQNKEIAMMEAWQKTWFK